MSGDRIGNRIEAAMRDSVYAVLEAARKHIQEQEREIALCRAALHEAQDYARQIRKPDASRVVNVFGRLPRGVIMVLQIVRTTHNDPDIVVEVELPVSLTTVNGERARPDEGHPWGDFLYHRCRVIDWLYDGEGDRRCKGDYAAIAQTLSMQSTQARMIHQRDRTVTP